MKNLLRALVPDNIYRRAADIRNNARLALLPRLKFDANPLRPVNSISLGTLFLNSEIQTSYEADSAQLYHLFGNDNRLGGVNPGDRRALYYLIKMLKPNRVLEIGTHIGASTLHIARALAPDATMVTVDIEDVNAAGAPWVRAGLERNPRSNVQRLGCGDRVEFVTSKSMEFFTKSIENKFDFIFLDGDHSGDAVYKEVSAALKVLNPGGVILLHDYYPELKPLFADNHVKHGPVRAMARIRKDNPGIGVLPLGNLPWPTKQGLHVTSLALIVRASADAPVLAS